MRTPFRTSWPHVAFTALLFAFFFPVVFCGKVLAPLDILDHLMRPWSDGAGGFGVHNAFVYDAISQYLPYDWAVCQSLKHDGFIGWNPYVYGGYALFENTMLCPGDWHHQLYRFFDFWTAWDLGIVLQFAIAGIGMIVMLRRERLPPFAALVGAVSFAFYSQHVIWIYHRWVLGASCWFPWIVWAVRSARRRNRLVDFWSIAFTALAFRGGSLQTCLFVATLVFCLFVADWWSRPERWRAQTIGRVLLPYAILAVGSTILVLDVLLATIPPFLEGCRTLAWKTPLGLVKSIPTLVTCVFPTVLGTPQTLDGLKPFGCGLFDIKYAGALPLFLALVSIRNKDAPLTPKLLLAVGLVIPFTPLVHWFYSRSTVVFALGCAWLAAWTVARLPESVSERSLHLVARIGALLAGLWLIVSVVLQAAAPRLVPVLHRVVAQSLPADKPTRLDWMLVRSDAFLRSLSLWHPQNLVPAVVAALGLVAIWRLVKRTERKPLWAALFVLSVFAEPFAWSRSWITFSDKPADARLLYPEQTWTRQLRDEMQDGGLLWNLDRQPDFDYLQLNAQTGIGIPSLQGYETIRPASLSRPDETRLDPVEFAERGVSHVLVLPGTEPPIGLTNWIERIDTADLHFYRNPAFESRWHARLADGSILPIGDNDASPNRHEFDLPAGTVSVSLAEPFHRGWTDAPGAELLCHAGKTMTGGTLVSFESPLAAPGSLTRSFHPRDPLRWPQLALLVLLGLTGISDNLRPGKRRKPVP